MQGGTGMRFIAPLIWVPKHCNLVRIAVLEQQPALAPPHYQEA
jgi:hypothetical protein